MTPKQEAFCIAMLDAPDASAAYRRAYDAQRMSVPSVNRAAKTLMDDPKIAARILELRKPVVKAALMTVEGHMAELLRIRDAALSAGKFSAAATAEMARGKVAGFYVEKVQVEDVTDRAAQMRARREARLARGRAG